MFKTGWLKKLLLGVILLILSLGLTLSGVEISLQILDLPKFYHEHSHPWQLDFSSDRGEKGYFVNFPSRDIEFIYDRNPRGYFGSRNEVVHHTNSWGFRGREFSVEKSPHTFRIACIGDSFTFGEGVKDEDTYCEQLVRILRDRMPEKAEKIEAYNFGVGGLNTTEIVHLFEDRVIPVRPDWVIYGYNFNDAEPPLFYRDPLSGEMLRCSREKNMPEFISDPLPPKRFCYRFRLARLIWQARYNYLRSKKIQDPYRSLYKKENPDWEKGRKSLQKFRVLCEEHSMPCTVLCFPVLFSLNAHYPYSDIQELVHHEILPEEVRPGSKNLIHWIDLFPYLEGRKDRDLWVHPTDQHPNEIVHRIAAQVLSEAFFENQEFRPPDQVS